MSKISGSTGALIQGVSQQPEGQRLPGQCWEQINYSSSPSDGLVRRPGSVKEGVLPILQASGMAGYFYERGLDEKYLVTVSCAGVLQVWDANTWTERTVNKIHPEYLTSDNGTCASANLRFHTVGDITFIANKSVKIKSGTAKSEPAPLEALINVMKGNYARAYKISVTWKKNGVNTNTQVTYTTRDSSNAAHEVDISADNISTKLHEALVAALLPADGWSITKLGNVIHMRHTAEFTIGSFDGNNDADMVVITKSVSKYANLPNRSVNGYRVQVQGKTGDDFNDYWLEFIKSPTSEDGRGKWKECLGPDLVLGEDPNTMPHILLRKADGTFKFGPAVDNFDPDLPNMHGWTPRACGDDDTNPFRSYVGYGVNDIGTFQDRLVFLVDENVVMSRSRDYFNFYKESATETSDADPLDFASSENEVSTLERMVLFDTSMVTFSKKTQFVTPGDAPVKHSNAVLQPKSSYDSSLLAAPVPSGTAVFFATEYGEFSGIREFFVEQQTDNATAALTTQHTAQYIKGRVRHMAASTNNNILLVQSDVAPNIVYAYEYYWQGSKKVQSSWSKWEFHDEVVHVWIAGTDAYFLVNEQGNVQVQRIDLTRRKLEETCIHMHLDSLQRGTVVNGVATFPLPSFASADRTRIIGTSSLGSPGHALTHMRINSTTFQLSDPTYNGFVWYGRVFDSGYRLTMPRVTDAKGHALLSSRQQVMYLLFNVTESGDFVVETTVFNTTYKEVFEPVILDATELIDSEPPLRSATFKVPIRAETRNCECWIKSTGHLPVAIADIEWVINMRQKGRRVG